MKNILITNDDGILAHGIIRLAEAAKAFGKVWVIAPENQRSALSHSITLRETIDIRPHVFPVDGVSAWACSGTPADCVRIGLQHLMPEMPDAVLSGINFGYNMASDIQYSATVGAAMEAAHCGILGVAISESRGESHEITDAYLSGILEEVLTHKAARDEILNVNFPYGSLQECRGILRDRRVSTGSLYLDRFKTVQELPDGGTRLAVNGIYNEDCEEGTDFRAIMDHYISIGKVRNIGW